MKMFLLDIMLLSFVACGHAASSSATSVQNTNSDKPKQLTYSIVNTYPHATDHYTQGLMWYEGSLYEGTGEYAKSKLCIMNLDDGKEIKTVSLAPEYFGEGTAILNGKLYQLTWLEQKGFIYNPATLTREGEFTYDGEGWGLTSDSSYLYMSDGSQVIKVINPDGWRTVRQIFVKSGKTYVKSLNELEWIDGRIWANLYGYNRIVVINPTDGNVEAYLDLDKLADTQKQNPQADVLNGIAYDKLSKKIFVTGKNWNKLFEITINTK